MSLEWWQKNVMYQVYLPSFKDSNHDGFGDFRGLISKLDYFEELNVKTLLLSPFYTSPMKDNGYDVSSFTDIDPIYGNMADFDLLMEEIKKRDMNIVVNLVANHTSDQHEWFQKSIKKVEPYTDYYIWIERGVGTSEDELLPPNNWLSVFGGSAWTWNEERQEFYFHQFLREQPDLNYRNPLVLEEIKKVMVFWLEKGVDGFRIDAASHLLEDERLIDEPVLETSGAKEDEHKYLNHIYTKGHPGNCQLLKEFRGVLDEYEEKTGKAKLMVAEVIEDIASVMKYYGTVGNKIADFPFNFMLYKIRPTFTGYEVFEKINVWLSYMPKGKYPNWVLSSHDDYRVISRLGRRLAISMHMVNMLLPGIPIVYYGDEIGMENTAIKNEEIRDCFALRTSPKNSRDPMRTPMQWSEEINAGFTDGDKPWLPIHENYKTVNVQVERGDSCSYLNHFKQLLKFRDEPSVLVGLLEFPLVNESIFSFLRYLVNAKCFLLVLNMSSNPVCIDLTNSSSLLPRTAFVEACSRHFPILDNAGLVEAESIAALNSKYPDLNAAASSFCTISDRKVYLKNVLLMPKEAIVLSFIGKQKQ